MNKEEIKSHYPTVYITLISILLGLALSDLVSVFRSLNSPGYFEWFSLIYVVLVIINAWVAYSLHAISIKSIPVPADAINVFAISVAHFSLNSFIGKPHYQVYLAVAFYSLVSFFTIVYIIKRASNYSNNYNGLKFYKSVLSTNILGIIIASTIAFLSYKELLSMTIEIIIFIVGYIFAFVWLYFYWGTWKKILDKSTN